MSKSPAVLRRHTAIGMLAELYLPTPTDPEDGSPAFIYNYAEERLATPHEVAENIDKLTQLGRTDKWRDAVHHWSNMVRTYCESPKQMRWAFLQGLIDTNYYAS